MCVGALLTAYIKQSDFFFAQSSQYSDLMLGIFRGAGAVFGVISTYLFRPTMQRTNLVTASIAFIWTEAGGLILALIMFLLNAQATNYLFLVFVLLSRVGLYGFCIGEVQIAQLGIRPEQRGAVNSIESALTSAATMMVYLFGAVLYQPENFRWLVFVSAICITAGAVAFTIWSFSRSSKPFWDVRDEEEPNRVPDAEEARAMLHDPSDDDEDTIADTATVAAAVGSVNVSHSDAVTTEPVAAQSNTMITAASNAADAVSDGSSKGAKQS